MKLRLLRELLELNQAFETVVRGLERMEKVTSFHSNQLRYARAEVESTRVSVNREFFDKFRDIVEKDARWAYQFLREYDRKTQDPFDLYLEIKQREDARQKKGLRPRVQFLPDWDKDNDEPIVARKRARGRKRRTDQ
jgi:hypothetical protein